MNSIMFHFVKFLDQQLLFNTEIKQDCTNHKVCSNKTFENYE